MLFTLAPSAACSARTDALSIIHENSRSLQLTVARLSSKPLPDRTGSTGIKVGQGVQTQVHSGLRARRWQALAAGALLALALVGPGRAAPAPIRLVQTLPAQTMPTAGPLILFFNTALDPGSVTAAAQPSVPGRFLPAGPDIRSWAFYPNQPLQPGQSFSITLDTRLRAGDGRRLDQPLQIVRTAERPPTVTAVAPQELTDLLPFTPIRLRTDIPLRSAALRLTGVPGRVQITGAAAVFLPDVPYPPADLRLEAVLVSAGGEPAPAVHLNLRGSDMQDRTWVSVRLAVPQQVTIWQGYRPERRLPASGGRPGFATPRGAFYLQNRGRWFFSERYQQGAYHWVRITGNYLFHSVPFDAEGRLIEAEAQKLGCPASHGCIRLGVADARWFYHHVPDGTLAVIHD